MRVRASMMAARIAIWCACAAMVLMAPVRPVSVSSSNTLMKNPSVLREKGKGTRENPRIPAKAADSPFSLLPSPLSATRFQQPANAALVAPGIAAAGGIQDTSSARRKVVFVAGRRSHAYGSHDHWAGSLLLSRWLNENHPGIEAVVHRDGWPADRAAFDGTAAVVVYADGGRGHPAVGHLDEMAAMMKRGVGLVLLHYAVEVEEATAGPQFLDWAGGYFKINWSVNPHWLLEPRSLPRHPVTRGVAPFKTHDEWYYHMQFRDGMAGVVPILSALPPESTLSRPDGPHSGNPAVRAAVVERKEPQHVAWATERADGGRAFGFTGGHWHWNWGHPMQRRLVLNAIAWAAKAEVPPNGIGTPRVTIEDLEANNEEEPSAVWLGLPPPPRADAPRPADAAAAAGGQTPQGAARGGRGGGSSAETPTRATTITRLEQWHKDFPPGK